MLLYSFMTIPPLIFFLLITSTPTSSMDPLSWGMVAGAGVFTSFLYSSYDSIKASVSMDCSSKHRTPLVFPKFQLDRDWECWEIFILYAVYGQHFLIYRNVTRPPEVVHVE